MTLRSAQIRSSAVFFGVVLALAVAFAGDRGVPAKNGIGNFGQVNERLYRGAEPDAVALKKLQQMGVKAIVDLRNKPDVSAESGQAALNGLVYTNIPMRGLGRPGDDEVARVLDLIETLPSPVFVHCQHGCDRTGTIVACYRIRHDGWLNELALREAETYGMQFVSIPVSGFSPPTSEQLARFFSVLRQSPQQTVFVHCAFGDDRTGVFIASYRIAFEHWTVDQALSEMLAFGFRRFWHPAMVEYIRALPQQLQSDPVLKSALASAN